MGEEPRDRLVNASSSPLGAKLKKQWFNLTLLGLLTLAVLRPELGSADGPLHPKVLRVVGIVTIFFLSGLTLRMQEIRTGLRSYKLHLFAQGFGFVYFPAVALLLRAWGPSFVPEEILHGLVALSILPTTITSCVVFTTLARGNVSGAVFNAVVGNLAGVFLSPLLFSIFVARTAGVQIEWSQLTDILLLIVVPLMAGVAVRRAAGDAMSRVTSVAPYVSGSALLTIVFLAFTSAFSPASPLWRWSLPHLISPLATLVALHVFFLCSAWWLAKLIGLGEADRRAALFIAPQKTVALGLPLLQFFLAGKPELAGILSIPLIFYHPLQLLVAGPLAVRLAGRDPN
jgi:sodium/bile acid cotransporter 7